MDFDLKYEVEKLDCYDDIVAYGYTIDWEEESLIILYVKDRKNLPKSINGVKVKSYIHYKKGITEEVLSKYGIEDKYLDERNSYISKSTKHEILAYPVFAGKRGQKVYIITNRNSYEYEGYDLKMNYYESIITEDYIDLSREGNLISIEGTYPVDQKNTFLTLEDLKQEVFRRIDEKVGDWIKTKEYFEKL